MKNDNIGRNSINSQTVLGSLCNSALQTKNPVVDESADIIGETENAIGNYEIIEKIGEGGFGKVYKVKDESGKIVALKIGSIADADRFEREVQALKTFSHENIVEYFDSGIVVDVDKSFFYIAMEYVPGVTLQEILDVGKVDTQAVIMFAERILRGLVSLHKKGFIHRDLKPSNILINVENFSLKIADFGLVKAFDNQAIFQSRLTKTGALIGTALYMSPEQVTVEGNYTPTLDIWAFGAILYQLFTGNLPFVGKTEMQLGAKILHEQPDFRKIPANFRNFIKCCLNKDRDLRFVDANETLFEFQKIAQPFLKKYYYEQDRENWFKILDKNYLYEFAELKNGTWEADTILDFQEFILQKGLNEITDEEKLENVLKVSFDAYLEIEPAKIDLYAEKAKIKNEMQAGNVAEINSKYLEIKIKIKDLIVQANKKIYDNLADVIKDWKEKQKDRADNIILDKILDDKDKLMKQKQDTYFLLILIILLYVAFTIIYLTTDSIY